MEPEEAIENFNSLKKNIEDLHKSVHGEETEEDEFYTADYSCFF